MKILVNDHRKLFTIEEEFSKLFPCLKLEFFVKPSSVNGATSGKIIKHGGKTIGECRTIHKKGLLTITPNMKVTDLKEIFRDVYGLNIQVLRKARNVWVETNATDSWTLEEQNKEGESYNKIDNK